MSFADRPDCAQTRSAVNLWPELAKCGSGMPIHANALPHSRWPPCAAAWTTAGLWRQSLARSIVVVITATAPSVSRQKSRRGGVLGASLFRQPGGREADRAGTAAAAAGQRRRPADVWHAERFHQAGGVELVEIARARGRIIREAVDLLRSEEQPTEL